MRAGWINKKLLEIADVNTGKYDANHAIEGGAFRFYTCAYNHLMCNTNRFSGESLILPGNGVNVGEVFYYDGEFDAYQRTYVINNIKISAKFLHFHMQLFWKELGTKLQYGAATNFIKIGNFQNYEVSFPPLPEQQRIVSILDEAFAAIDKAKANAEKNLKNAKELFESYLQGVFENKGDGWEEMKISEIGLCQTGSTPKTTDKENFGNFIPFIKPADINFNGVGDIRYTNDGLSEIGVKKARNMKKGSILMVCIGATIGKVGFSEIEVSCNQQINSLTPKEEYEPKYIYYAMSSKSFQEKVISEGKSAQATLPIINKSKWENLSISIHLDKDEQRKYSIILDSLSAETKRLESIYQQKLTDLEELKKSILQKAFNGELNTADLCV